MTSSATLQVLITPVQVMGSRRPGQVDQLTPLGPSLKFGAEFRNCIWRLCRTDVKVMAMTTCLTLIH